MKWYGIAFAVLLILAGCAVMERTAAEDGKTGFQQISQEEAGEMMAKEDGHIILDVRRQEEFDAGHIPGAVCLPNESIGPERPELLPDPEQIILVYCRTGNRSKQAAGKLAELGYVNVFEFGGINDWKGEIVVEKETEAVTEEAAGREATLVFDSFDGGGPEYSVEITDPSIVSYTGVRSYGKDDHEMMTGAGYSVIYTFTGERPGETTLTVSARSPIAENFDAVYSVTVDADLNVTLEALPEGEESEAPESVPILVIEANGQRLYASLADNSSAEALAEKLSEGKTEVSLHDYGNFEKVGPLPWELPRNDEPITTEPGDVILYQGNQITIYYDENSWTFTRLARVEGYSRETLLDILGDGDVTVNLWIEWSE